MTDFLVVQLADDTEQARWAGFDGSGHLLSPVTDGPLADARQDAVGRRVVLMVPAIDVVTTQAVLPAGSPARLRQLAPYSLEESLADDVDELAFAVGPRLTSGAVSVSIVARERLAHWLAEAEAAGLTPSAVYAESDGVPDTPGTLTLMVRGTRIFGRRPAHAPFVVDGLSIVELLEVLRGGAEEEPADLRHLVVFTDDAGRRVHLEELASLHERVTSADIKLLPDGVFPHLAAALVLRSGTNLLQGPYAPKSNWIALARPWRVAAALAVALGAIALAGLAVEYLALRREAAALDERIAAGCERMTGSARLSSCRAEIDRRLGGASAGGGGESFLSTLAAVADARTADSRIEQLSYRNRVMDLQLMAGSVNELDEFARALGTTRRFQARIESSNPNDEGVQGRVQVVGASR